MQKVHPLHSSPPCDRETLWTPAYITLLMLSLLLCSWFYMLPATLPAYVKQIGGSNFQASLAIGAFSVMSLVARMVSASIVDRFGEMRLIALGIITIAVTTLTFIWLPVKGILLLRALQGVGWGVATAAIATAVFKIIPASRRGEGADYYALTVIELVLAFGQLCNGPGGPGHRCHFFWRRA